MRTSIKLYRVSCKDLHVKKGIPCEVLDQDKNILLDKSIFFKKGKMDILKEAEIKELDFEGVFYKWVLSKRKTGIFKWIERKNYIKAADTVLIWIRSKDGKEKMRLLDKGERTDLFSVTASLRYCGDGKFRTSEV